MTELMNAFIESVEYDQAVIYSFVISFLDYSQMPIIWFIHFLI